MPNWKKVITSGSNAHLNEITASGKVAIGDSLQLESSKRLQWVNSSTFIQGTDSSLSIDGDNIVNFFADTRFIFHDANVGIGIGNTNPTNALEVEGNISASGTIITGDVSASGDIINSQFVQMRNSSSVIDTFNTGSHQTCKYILQVASASHIQSSEMLVIQNGLNAFNTEYAQIGTDVNLGSFSTSVSGNVVKLNFAGSFISCSVKFNRILI